MKRNYGIDLLRLVLMYMIVAYHVYFAGWRDAVNEWWTLIFAIGFIWHVDAFISISGFYGIRFKWSKVVRLCALVAFYNILDFLFSGNIALSQFRVTGGWFVGAYLALMCLSPILNRAMVKIPVSSEEFWRACVCGGGGGLLCP